MKCLNYMIIIVCQINMTDGAVCSFSQVFQYLVHRTVAKCSSLIHTPKSDLFIFITRKCLFTVVCGCKKLIASSSEGLLGCDIT
jgi:hypothetical protein